MVGALDTLGRSGHWIDITSSFLDLLSVTILMSEIGFNLNGVKLYICSYSRETFFQNMVLKSLPEAFKLEVTY